MRIDRVVANGRAVAVVEDDMPMITDPMVAMEIAMRARFELGAERLAVEASALAPEFFDPAGEVADGILAQLAQFGVKGAVFGDLSLFGEAAAEALKGKVLLAADKKEALAGLTQE